MKKRLATLLILLFMCRICGVALAQGEPSDLPSRFKTPPSSLYAFWFWMGTNISKEGITKDLEAMHKAGFEGAIIMHVYGFVDGKPLWPERTFRSPYWWEAVKHAAAEADRLGMKITLTNGAGWAGTNGTWIDQKRAMRRLVWSFVQCDESSPAELHLPKPQEKPKAEGFYEDVAVLAVADGKTVPMEKVIDLTSMMQPDGKLNWKAPAGKWLVYRIGTTPTMVGPHPVPEGAWKSLEVDKLSQEHNRFHWQEGVINPLKEQVGKYVGTSLNGLHVDSYECGGQNWTATFRETFTKNYGYDPVPWLVTFGSPVLGWPEDQEHGGKMTTGLPRNEQSKFIDSEAKTMRFERDYRENISRMFNDTFRTARKLMNENNLLFSFEPYAGPFNSFEAAGSADVPMATFWFSPKPNRKNDDLGIFATAAQGSRPFGGRIVGAESFTGWPADCQWTEHPAEFKYQADGAYATGINRLTFHHWVHQPFDDRFQPGMSMSHFGIHLSRHQTWFEQGKAFFAYLNRCQLLLQQGQEVIDCLSLDAPTGYSDVLSSYDFVNDNTRVENGQIVLGSGRRYFYLSIPYTSPLYFLNHLEPGKMLPEVAEKLLRLVQAGAVVVGTKPDASPSLKDYPNCDTRVSAVARELWESGRYSQQIFTKVTDATKALGLEPDYIDPSRSLKINHRRSADGDFYFLSNRTLAMAHSRVSFRISGRQPELWQAEDGSIINAPVWAEKDGRTTVQVQLAPQQSIFVVFRKNAGGDVHPTEVTTQPVDAEWFATVNENGRPTLRALETVDADVRYSDGTSKKMVHPAPREQVISGPWPVTFKPKLGEPFQVELPELADFSKHADDKLRYFSGTAVYRKEVNMAVLAPNESVVLDLGELHSIASVRVNGGEDEVIWYPPWRIDIGKRVKPGTNTIEISVTTTWANAVIGDERLPFDYKTKPRKAGGTMLNETPAWLGKAEARPSGRKTFAWPMNYYTAESQPVPAGLTGRVRMLYEKRIDL